MNTNRRTAFLRGCRLLRRAWSAAAVIGMTAVLPASTYAQGGAVPPVPSNLQVPDGNVLFLVGHAVGTQNYVCVPADSIGHVAWALFTPQATLFDDQGEQIITHFFSPNPAEGVTVRAAWEDSVDTSTVWGKVLAASADPAFVKAAAIPWLLIGTAGTKVGPTGGDKLAVTTFIQRLNTVRGTAPATGCDLPTDIGSRAFVPYRADYFFYRK